VLSVYTKLGLSDHSLVPGVFVTFISIQLMFVNKTLCSFALTTVQRLTSIDPARVGETSFENLPYLT